MPEKVSLRKIDYDYLINERVRNIIEAKRKENESALGMLNALESSWDVLGKKMDEGIKEEFELIAVDVKAIERAKNLVERNPCIPVEENLFVIAGKVVDQESKIGLPSLTIKVERNQHTLPEMRTDSFGNFALKVLADKLNESSLRLVLLGDGIRVPEDIQLSFPHEVKDKIWYDSTEKKLTFQGVMSEEEKRILLKISQSEWYKKAIEILYKRSQGLEENREEVIIFSVFSEVDNDKKLVAKETKSMNILPGKGDDVIIRVCCGEELKDYLEAGKSVKESVENDANVVGLRHETMKSARTAITKLSELGRREVNELIRDISVPQPEYPLLRKKIP